MKPLEIRILQRSKLIPAEYNPRRVTASARRKLKASLETFGLVEPLVWNERTGRVVGGHQRLAILAELGVEEVPVSVVRLSEPEEKALNVVLNNLEAQGRYEPGKLHELLLELAPLPELAATGFELSTLKSLELAPVEDGVNAPPRDEIEVTLAMSRATFDALSPRLDALIREFDLESHVRGASASARPCKPTRGAASPLP